MSTAIVLSSTATALAALATGTLVLHARARNRVDAGRELLADLTSTSWNFDPSGKDRVWIGQMNEFLQTVHQATPGQLQDLNLHYTHGWSRRATDALSRAVDWATTSGRLAVVTDQLSYLKVHNDAALAAGYAILVRDLLTYDDWAAITLVWYAADLPIPGGDAAPVYLVSIEFLVDGTWTARSTETLPAPSGDGPQQLAEGLVQILESTQKRKAIGAWRIRVWTEMDPDGEPAGEAFHHPQPHGSR